MVMLMRAGTVRLLALRRGLRWQRGVEAANLRQLCNRHSLQRHALHQTRAQPFSTQCCTREQYHKDAVPHLPNSDATACPSQLSQLSQLSQEQRAFIKSVLNKNVNTATDLKPVARHSLVRQIHVASKDVDVAAAAVLQQKAVLLAEEGVLLPETFFHSLVYIYAEAQMPLDAFKAYNTALSLGLKPTENVLSKLAAACATEGDLELAFEAINTMQRLNIQPHFRTYWKVRPLHH